MAEQDSVLIPRAVEDFMREAKNLRNKQDFLYKMAEFEKRFTVSNANLDKSVSYSESKQLNNNTEYVSNPFFHGEEDKRKVQNPFKNTDRKNYHKPPSHHSRTQTDFYKPLPTEQDFQRLNMQNSDFGKSERNNIHPSLIPKQYIEPQLQELLIQQQMHNAKMAREQMPYGPASHQQQFYPQPNQFLRQHEDEPDYVKFYRKQTPPSGPPSPIPKSHTQINNTIGHFFGGQNPFQKR